MVLWTIRDNRPPYLDLVKLSSLNFTPVEAARKSQPPVMHMTLLLSTPRALSVSWPGRKLRLCVQAVSAQWFRRGRWLIHAFPEQTTIHTRYHQQTAGLNMPSPSFVRAQWLRRGRWLIHASPEQTMRHTRYHQQTAGLNMPSPSFVRAQWFRKYRLCIHAFRKRQYIYMLPPTCHRLYLSVRYDSEEVNSLIMHSRRRRRYNYTRYHPHAISFMWQCTKITYLCILQTTIYTCYRQQTTDLNMSSVSFASSPVMNDRLLLL